MNTLHMKRRLQSGFSLLEMMAVLVILTIVFAVVAEALITMQGRNVTESSKVDLTQQSREFMDQIISDVHQAGYPPISAFAKLDPVMAPSADCTQDQYVSCGIRSMSQNSLQFEGDVDGSGVSEVFIQESPANGPCPCTIQRGTISKATFIANPSATPPYYTEVDNVLNTNIFVAFNSDGLQPFTLTTSAVTSGFNNVANIEITLYVQGRQLDPKTKQYPTVTMVSSAKITNINSL